MPKITVHGGASYKLDPAREEEPSAGNSSSTSSESESKKSDKPESNHLPPAPTTESPSVEAPKASSSARPTGGNGKSKSK